MNDHRLTVYMTDELHRRTKLVATHRKTTLTDVVRAALESYLGETEIEELVGPDIAASTDEDAKMRREKAAFAAQRQVLQQHYPGEYVAIHAGSMIDHDVDLAALHLRVVQAVGAVPVLLKRVDEPVYRELVFRSPHLERSLP